MGNPRQLFFLMNGAFWGFFLAVLYGALTSAALWMLAPAAEFKAYHQAFFAEFNCAIAGGLVATTAILVQRTQTYIPDIIQRAFTERELRTTDYHDNRERFFSLRRSLTFSSSFALAAFGIFSLARFPFQGMAEYFMIAFGCMQYALGVYVGRKLFYIAQMLRSIDGLKVKKDLFRAHKLDGISTYVNSISTLTVILVIVAVRTYYYAPFEYDSVLGDSVRSLMLLPAVIAIPVLVLFNYFPRSVVQRLYEHSIEHSRRRIEGELRKKDLTEFERLTYLVEYEKITRDDLKHKLKMTLNDLPMAITLAITVISVLLGKLEQENQGSHQLEFHKNDEKPVAASIPPAMQNEEKNQQD